MLKAARWRAESGRLWYPEEERGDWDDEVREGGAYVFVCSFLYWN